ncbi:MAG: hypothetical protein ACJ8CB_33060 [Ktedonobacteraceae bacterium]
MLILRYTFKSTFGCMTAALHGVLAKIRDLGLPLLSVNNITNGRARKEEQ